MEVYFFVRAAVFTREVGIAVSAVEMEAASDDYCRCCRKKIDSHYVTLFGERATKEGIIKAVCKYGNIDVTEEDIGVLSTSICRSCYLLVKGIVERIGKFADICQEGSQDKNELKRSVGERSPSQITVSPVQLSKRSKQLDEGTHRSARMSLRFQPILPKPIGPPCTEVSI